MRKITVTIEVTEQEHRLLRSHSLERVLSSLLEARTREDFLTVQEEAYYLKPLASILWYAASSQLE